MGFGASLCWRPSSDSRRAAIAAVVRLVTAIQRGLSPELVFLTGGIILAIMVSQ